MLKTQKLCAKVKIRQMDRFNKDCILVCYPVKTVQQLIMVLLLDYEQLQTGRIFLAQVE
jgi:hypothetical protein